MRPALIAGLALLAAACGPKPAPPSVPVVAIAAADPTVIALASDPEPPREARASVSTVNGVGRIHLGQSAAEVRALLGPETSLVTREDEEHRWIEAGYEPDKSIVFLLGFEQLMVYDDPPPKAEAPYWKLYLQHDRVMYLVVTAYGSEALPMTRKTGFPPDCFLLGPESGVRRTFGEADAVSVDDNHEHTTYHYLATGLSVIASADQIRVFDIFGPIDPERRDGFARLLEKRGKQKAAP
jgi:hypothetical protein